MSALWIVDYIGHNTVRIFILLFCAITRDFFAGNWKCLKSFNERFQVPPQMQVLQNCIIGHGWTVVPVATIGFLPVKHITKSCWGLSFFFFFYKKKFFQSGWFYFALKVSRLGYSIFSIHFATILTKKKFLSKNTSRKWKCSHFTKCWIEYLTLNNQIIGNGPFICKCIPDYNISVKLITCYIYSHSNILCPLLFFTNRPTTTPDLALMNKLFY